MPRIKKKAHENLTSTNVEYVISLLNPKEGKPVTKKEACSILNIAYNTARLQRIIDAHKETKAFIQKRKDQNRGKRASEVEISQVISEYLEGEPISTISKSLFRSSGFVRGIIKRMGVPFRPTSAEGRSRVGFLPEQCISESFNGGELVWSAKYHAPAVVKKRIEQYDNRYLGDCYHIYVLERVDATDSFFPYIEYGGFNAYTPFYDLGSLKHLNKYGINLDVLKNIS